MQLEKGKKKKSRAEHARSVSLVLRLVYLKRMKSKSERLKKNSDIFLHPTSDILESIPGMTLSSSYPYNARTRFFRDLFHVLLCIFVSACILINYLNIILANQDLQLFISAQNFLSIEATKFTLNYSRTDRRYFSQLDILLNSLSTLDLFH